MEIIQLFALVFWLAITLFGMAAFMANFQINGFSKKSLLFLTPFFILTIIAIISKFN